MRSEELIEQNGVIKGDNFDMIYLLADYCPPSLFTRGHNC